MRPVLSDAQIDLLLQERKPLPSDWRTKLDPRMRDSNSESDHAKLHIQGAAGNRFRIHIRDNSKKTPLDFSVILVFTDEGGNEYRLLRHNGLHPSEHTNKWERDQGLENVKFRKKFHIHHCTERYQIAGYEEDGYVEPTAKFQSLESALVALFDDHNFVYPGERAGQGHLKLGTDDE